MNFIQRYGVAAVIFLGLVWQVPGKAENGLQWKRAATFRYQFSGIFVDVVSVPLKARKATDLRMSVSYYCSAKLLKMDLVSLGAEDESEIIPYFHTGTFLEGSNYVYYYRLGMADEGGPFQIDQIHNVTQSYGGYGCEVVMHTALRP